MTKQWVRPNYPTEKAKSTPTPSELRSLARDILRVSPDRQNPEQFYLAKERIATRLQVLARQLEASR